MRSTRNGDVSLIAGYDDENSNPQTIRARASQHIYTDDDRWVPSASFLMPAPGGWTYKGTMEKSGAPASAVQFIGLGNVAQQGLKAWEEVPMNTLVTAAQDGFVVAWDDWNGSDAQGTIEGAQTLSPGVTSIAGASLHVKQGGMHVPCNSFTMPIRRGTSYQVTSNAVAGTPLFEAAFVPLD